MDRTEILERIIRETARSARPGRRGFSPLAFWLAWDGKAQEFGLTEDEERAVLAKVRTPPRPELSTRGPPIDFGALCSKMPRSY